MTMAAMEIPDLEDGEIESGDEEITENPTADNNREVNKLPEEIPPQEINSNQDLAYSKSGKKKKSKSNKGDKYKEKNKKHRRFSSPVEEDFAGSIEKAIRKAMNGNEESSYPSDDGTNERRKPKKRKKNDAKEHSGKKRKKQDFVDEVDESEMMCIRGASPVKKQSPSIDSYNDEERDSYASDSSVDSKNHHSRSQRHRPQQRERKNKGDRDRRRNAYPMQDPDGVCVYFMQGKCHKGDDCVYSHDAKPPRKMELCKFYLMDCCAKRDKCLYMHSDFPCKFYHTGLPCIYKDECKFAHGKPLTEVLKSILMKHIESAPKEILGDFPRLSREGATNMIANTQIKLQQQYAENSDNHDKSIPSLFELNIPKPNSLIEPMTMSPKQVHERHNKISPKVRQSRWQNDAVTNHNSNIVSNNLTGTNNVLNIKNLNGVLTSQQITTLTSMGIENLDQLGQLTVLQLNSIGISVKQINDIQLNTMCIQKLGLINNNSDCQTSVIGNSPGHKDLDLRVPPMIPVKNSSNVSELPGKDIDMRFQASLPTPSIDADIPKPIVKCTLPSSIDTIKNKDMIDIDQYTKDALKFASKDNDNTVQDNFESGRSLSEKIIPETKDIDHRVLKFPENNQSLLNNISTDNGNIEHDTDIRFLHPSLSKMAQRRHRRSTTDDDDDNNLLIDEKWYSSDEEKSIKKKSPLRSPTLLSPPSEANTNPAPQIVEPSSVLSKLGDLSKIDISEEVTKLLNTMKHNLHDVKNEKSEDEVVRTRDPRMGIKRSPDYKVNDLPKVVQKKPPRVSIYECIDGEPTDGRRRTDVDLRKTDPKMHLFGDTDLRQTGGDIDFRLGLPFKAIPNYTPASEIDGSFNSHPPMSYKLVSIDIPRPDYTDIRNSTAKSQALLDPRLRKVFRLSVDDSNSDSEKSSKTSNVPRIDPRRKPIDTQEQKQSSLELQSVLQNSDWYKDLSSTQKIFVNQHLATVTSMLKQFQQDKIPGKTFDVVSVQRNPILSNILSNLGVCLVESGEFNYLPKQKEALLKTPMNFPLNPNNFGMGTPNLENSGINMMNMPHMGMGPLGMNNMNIGPMPSFNSFQDPRSGPTPGLLGVAPNMPHNFGNMPFNGPNNDYGNMDGGDFPRYSNRGGFRGRGNERWNRSGGGNSGRGNRDRKNYSDRGGWKN